MVTAMNERSAKFDKVKGYYEARLWTESMVRNAAKNPKNSPWITDDEADEIIYGPIVDEDDSDIANED